jgi:hypothetical protein
VSPFIGAAYIVCCVLVLFAPILAAVSSRWRGASLISALVSWVATILLLAVSAVSPYGVYKKVVPIFHDEFSDEGISTTVGKLFILSWIAAAFSLFTSVILSVRFANSRKQTYGQGPSAKPSARSAAVTGGEPQDGASAKAPGLWGKIPTWKSHKYVQIEKQPAIVRTNVRGHEEAILMDDDDVVRRESLVQEKGVTTGSTTGVAEKGIQMMSLGKGGKKDLNTAYEPYSTAPGV